MKEDNNQKVDVKEGAKPAVGLPNIPFSLPIMSSDSTGRVTDLWYQATPINTKTYNADITNESARIGDYIIQNGRPVVFPDSPTDIAQRYQLVIGGTEKPAELLSPSSEALSIIGPATTGAMIGGPVGAVVGLVGGLAGGLVNYNNAREEAIKRWRNENVKYDSAVEFYRDDKGGLKYKIDYQKMGTGGARSGEGIKEAQTRETQVSLGDDGRLKIKVSPIFASTARFQELVDFISENYGGLSKNTENLDEVLTEIKNGIDGEAKSYISNMRLYADFAQKFQNASPETIVASYTTEMAGYVDPAQMKDYQMSVLGDGDIVTTKSAEEFFNSVLSMDKGARNDLATKLNDIIYGESNDYSDNQRAIAYGELQAMYTASANPEKFENNKYQGMMDADRFASFMNSFSPLGLIGGDVLKFLSGGAYSKQEMLNPDEWAQFFGGLAGIGAGFGIRKGGTSLIENALKRLPGTAALFNASISGKGTEAMAWLAQNTGNTSVLAKAWGAEAAFKMVKLGIFDAALAGSQTAVSNEDFWSNFGRDFARDAILEALFSYYDMVAFKQATSESMVHVYEDPKTGNMVPVRVPEGETIPEQIILTGDDTPVDETFTSVGLSGKPEEFVRSGNGTSVYKLKGKANITKTRTGDVVGIYEDPNVSQIMLNGKTYTISHTAGEEGSVLLESGDIGIDEFPVMSSGVVNVTPSSDADEISKIMAKMNLPANTKTWEVPESSANAALVAGKIAKVQATKAGMEGYKQLFNKNGVLDVANNMALAKDGDLNSWRNAQEYFVSVQNNAMRNLQDIQNGVYFKEAALEWAKTVELMGKFNYEYKYKPKTDGSYINAILNIERAELLNQTRVEGDTTDYVAKAVETYGDVLAKMPADRGQLLQDWVQQGKKWLKAFNESVKKSGKVDIDKLEGVMDTDIDSEIGWFPVWGKKQTYMGLLDTFHGITKERNPYKSWLRDGEWVPANQLGDPWQNMTRYMGFVTNNMGLNDMIEQAATVYDRAGLLVDNTPTDATIRKRKLDSIKNKDELNKKLDEMIVDAKKEVEERTLTPAEYSEAMTKIYEESAIPETTESLGKAIENWDDFWNSAPAQTRKDIRNELEKTSLQTGYGISDTRARLNAQVPGADVLDWSLLGRGHTNGLVPGGLYTGKSAPVKAYIMSVDDLAKLAGYDLDKMPPNKEASGAIEKHINTKDAVPMLPAHIRGSGDGPEIWLKMRWGHNSDSPWHWGEYLKTLKERSIEKVPVAIDDARGSDFSSVFYQVRNSGLAQKGMDNMVAEIDRVIASGEKPNFAVRDISAALHLSGMSRDRLRKRIRRSIPSSAEEGVSYITNGELEDLLDEAAIYDWANDAELNSLADNIENVVKAKIGYVPQDITADVQQAFSEYGRIPFYHGQHAPLGSMEYNDPSGARDAYRGAGDAYWLAPNSSYTDDYGKNKLAGTIPIKYFMSDKEKNTISTALAKELRKLRDEAAKKGLAELKKEDDKILKNVKQEVLHTQKDSIDDAMAQFNLHEAGWSSGLEEKHGAANYYVDNLGLLYKGKHHFIDGNVTKKLPAFDFTFTPLNEIYHTPREENQAIEDGSKLLPKKDKARYDELYRIVEPYIDGQNSSKVISYRALAEYAKKPIIDISEDDFAAGTAFFYYKGVDPKFDEEIGQQLAAQALFDRQNPQWTGDTIANAMENYDDMSLDEMIDSVTMGQGFGEDWDDLFEQFNAGEISSSELSEEVSKFFEGVEKKYPGIGKVMQETWDNNTIQDLRDMKFKYWHPSTGYPTIDDNVAGQFLEEMGERPPQAGEPVPEGQTSMWDVIDPTSFANVPTDPQFKQPRRVTYEDYKRGAQADPDMPVRIQSSYRAAMANRLIKEATRAVGLAEDYLSEYGYGADWQSYLNTSLIPDLQNAINQNMLPDEFSSFVQARMAQAIQDVAPYQSPELLLKSRLDGVAQEWRDWAFRHIKGGRVNQKELKEFVNSHNIELPSDNRPYPSKIKHALWEMVQNNKRLPEIEGINPTAISKEMDKKLFYQMLDDTPLFRSAVKDKDELLDLMALERNKETTDSFTMGTAATAAGLGGRYPMTWFKKGKPYTRFIKYDTKGHLLIAEQTTKALNDKELLKEDGLISKAMAFAANDFRLLTTGWDPSRSLPNLSRDTGRSFTLGRRFINAKEMLKSSIDAGSYTPKQREKLEKAIENAANAASSSSYNSAYRTTRANMKEITKDYLSQSGANPMKRFFYNVAHDKRSILEWPMEFFEGYSRRANARSLAAVQLRKEQKAGADFKTQLKNAAAAAEWAGREYTANFSRKGELIGRVSKYVAYQSSAYAGFDGMMRAFINDPKLVSRNFAAFVLAYLVLLADTLSREETRKQYYRLSDYDRENQIVIGMGDSILTIPMDQELAGLLFPYRRIMETLNGTDPVSFFEFVWGSLTAALPPDLSGFSEGDGFNLSRGLEKLTAQNMPTFFTPIQEAATGYDLYYGSNLRVTDKTLKDYGIYSPEPGDYTTTGKDSALLRQVANTTGIPQWQLQVMAEGYGGNVGKYVLNILDKLSGATKEQQGGKGFADTVFNSFTGLDQDAASSAFYTGITQLKDEKNKLVQKLAGYNEDLKTASGDAKVELQGKIAKAKQDYGTKVGDFVDKYVSAYELTGGLSKSQAQQIYYLFRLDDDDTLYQSGSVEEYYNNQSVQQFKNQATAMSAPILDKYYNNRLGNIYQDSEGVWRRYLSSGAQAMRNSVYGLGEQQKVDLLNILEGKNSNLTALRSQVKNARNKAYETGDWDTRDALAYEFDKRVVQAISPYIEKHGAENVLGNAQVLDYLSDWFFVPSAFKRTKKGGYVSLAHNAQTDEAFVRPYIKYIFGLPTNYYSYSESKLTAPLVGEEGE